MERKDQDSLLRQKAEKKEAFSHGEGFRGNPAAGYTG